MSFLKNPKAVGSLVGIFCIAGLFFNPLMTDPDGARDTLDSHGFTDIKAGGYSWLGCGKGDVWKTEFTAKNERGKEVSGIVCMGLFKGSTLRLE